MNQAEPLVSIIVPNYNHASYLEKRMESIINQTYPNSELIVIDDASSDSSLDVIRTFEKDIDQLIVNDENSGSPSKQWKKGIELARGEWVWIAESDDWCETTFLEKLLSRVNDAVGLVYAQTYDVENEEIIVDRLNTTRHFDPNIWEKDFEIDGLEFISKYLIEKNYIPNASAVIFRKSLVDDHLDPNLLKMKMCGDWLFWIRILRKTRISFLAEHLNYFRYHSNASRVHNSLERMKLRVLEEIPIRNEIRHLGIDQEMYLGKMEKKWFDYHKLSERKSADFSELNSSGLFDRLRRKFVSYKVRKKLLG